MYNHYDTNVTPSYVTHACLCLHTRRSIIFMTHPLARACYSVYEISPMTPSPPFPPLCPDLS